MSPLRLVAPLALMFLLSPSLAAQTMPARLSDSTFWALFRGLSEITGGFASENFTSNESGAAWIVPPIRAQVPAGRAYLGVGPEQNFTYIVALRPSIAFLLDIRAQAALQHLLYKALFELAPDRSTFLSLLFARSPVRGVDSTTPVGELIDAYRAATPSLARFDSTLHRVLDHLARHHGFALTEAEQEDINHVFQIAFLAGPRLSYNAGRLIPKRVTDAEGMSRLRLQVRRQGARLDTTWYLVTPTLHGWLDSVPVSTLWNDPVRSSAPLVPPPDDTSSGASRGASVAGSAAGSDLAAPPTSGVDFAALMVQEDSLGTAHSFLASEAHYRQVRDLHLRNVIVPVVGDFAGATALRGIGEQLHAWQTPVGAFYTSNVEEYLYAGGSWGRFYDNVATLPHDDQSLFIRAFLGGRIRARRSQPGVRVDLALGGIAALLEAFRQGRIETYADLIPLSGQ